MLRIIFCSLLLLFVGAAKISPIKRAWEYTILSTYANSSDSIQLDIDLKIERIDRGHFGLSGVVDIKNDVTDDYFIQFNMYRKPGGNSKYQHLPFLLKNQTINNFIGNAYKTLMMDYVKDCSNWPQYNGSWVGPVPALRYVMDKCTLTTESFPSYMPTGLYKICILITGKVMSYIDVIAKVESVDG